MVLTGIFAAGLALAAKIPFCALDDSSVRNPRNSAQLRDSWRVEGDSYVRNLAPVAGGRLDFRTAFSLGTAQTAWVEFLDAAGRPVFTDAVSGSGRVPYRAVFDVERPVHALRVTPRNFCSAWSVMADPLRIVVDTPVYETFEWVGAGGWPSDWTGRGASVQKVHGDPVLALQPGGAASVAFAPEAARHAVSFQTLVHAGTRLTATLPDGTAARWFGCSLYVGSAAEPLYRATPNVWYNLRFEIDPAGGTVRAKLNGRVLGTVPSARTGPAAGGTELRFENAGAGDAYVDDVWVRALPEFPDGVPEPVVPRDSKGNCVGVNVCSLWREGRHFGWQCVANCATPRPVLGFYDEAEGECADWEIKYMVEHGIDFQAFCWYAEATDRPLRHPGHQYQLEDGFKHAKWSDRMRYCLIWECANAGVPANADAWRNHYVPYFIEHHFKDPRYLTVKNRVVLFTFSGPDKLSNAFGGTDAVRAEFDYLEDEVRKLGFDGVLFVLSHSASQPKYAQMGYDATAAYNWGGDGWKYAVNTNGNWRNARDRSCFTIPTVSVGFNNEPWAGTPRPMMSTNDFARTLAWARDVFGPATAAPGTWQENLYMISTWNEYGEGTYIMPTEDERGFGYLDAVRAVFTDEKPDPSLNLVPTPAQRARLAHLFRAETDDDRFVRGQDFVLNGPVPGPVVVAGADASPEKAFLGVATNMSAELAASLANLRNPADTSLVVRAVSDGSRAVLRWTRADETDRSGAPALGAADYVQDGLAAQFDGVENAGPGVHDSAATAWRDLKGGASIPLAATAAWADDGLETGADNHYVRGLPALPPSAITVEAPVNVHSNGLRAGQTGNYWPRVFRANERFDAYFTGTGSNALLYVNRIDSPRPGFGTFRRGTLAAVSDARNFRAYADGACRGTSGSVAVPATAAPLDTTWNLNGHSGFLDGLYHGLRIYGRGLTDAEVVHNALVDGFRFFPRTWSGATRTNDCVRVAGGRVDVPAGARKTLLGLSLEADAELVLGAWADVAARVLYVGGRPVPAGVYTGNGPLGEQVDWLSGPGVLRVAGAAATDVPASVVLPAPGGWVTYGRLAREGGAVSANAVKGYPGGGTYDWILADWPRWSEEAPRLPRGARLRLQGYVVLEQIPDGLFADFDFVNLRHALLLSPRPFADGRPFVVPPRADVRYQPGCEIAVAEGTNWLRRVVSDAFASDLVLDGTLRIYGDGPTLGQQQFDGLVSGSGTVRLGNFGKQARFRGGFALNGALSIPENGQLVWIDALAVTSRLAAVTLSACGNAYNTDSRYNVAAIFFGRHGSAETADHPLFVEALDGQSRDVTDAQGVRWRCGGAVAVWGGNTLHAGRVTGPLHVVGRPLDLGCTRGAWLGSAVSAGTGRFVADEIANGARLFLSTNVDVRAGCVTGATCFDYTFHTGAANATALSVTGACSTAATVLATDVAMLPARLTGFRGRVLLSDAADRVYPMSVDVRAGTNAVYNAGGCAGSGTLAQAPAAGTVDLRLPACDPARPPRKGDYALARFDAGGERLANWRVVCGGVDYPPGTRIPLGPNGAYAVVKRDATGLWLRVVPAGLHLVVR